MKIATEINTLHRRYPKITSKNVSSNLIRIFNRINYYITYEKEKEREKKGTHFDIYINMWLKTGEKIRATSYPG